MRISIFGPFFLFEKKTVTSLRTAFPPSALFSIEVSSKLIPFGRLGLRPYTFVSNSFTISGRRCLRHVSALDTRSPLAITSGSGKVYLPAFASSWFSFFCWAFPRKHKRIGIKRLRVRFIIRYVTTVSGEEHMATLGFIEYE